MRNAFLLACVVFFGGAQNLSACSAPSALEITTLEAAAVQDEAIIKDLLLRGRKFLDNGQASEAQILFEQADALSRGELRTRVWLLRSWMDQGRVNDAFDIMDRMLERGAEGTAVDYIYGMGSYRRALRDQSGGMSKSVTFAFEDAVQYLSRVVESEADFYYDAWLPLAHAAWSTQKLELARSAVDKAVELDPANAQVHYWQGRILFSRFQQAQNAAEVDAELAGAEFGAGAEAAFLRSLELTPRTKERAANLHELQLQRGYLALWRKQQEACYAPFAEAIGWDPSSVDYAALFGSLRDADGGAAPYVQVLTSGHKQFVERYGAENNSDATLLWWLGYGQASLEQHARAEASYLASVSKWPAYVDSWWYLGRARYFQEDYLGAVQAWATLFDENPSTLVRLISSDSEANLQIVRYAVGKTVALVKDDDLSLNIPMAAVAEAVIAVDHSQAKYWNDLGLFCRDSGEHLLGLAEEGPAGKGSAERAQIYLERSWQAYQHAMTLAPADPAYINDGAVVLHLFLKRDLDKAAGLYTKAITIAEAQIAADALDEVQLKLVKQALGDAQKNLETLRRERREAGK